MGNLFEIEISSLHYIHAVGSYQQITSAKCAVHTAVAEMAITIWHLQASEESFLITPNFGTHGKFLPTTRAEQSDIKRV